MSENKFDRTVYLSNIPREEALQKWLNELDLKSQVEIIPVNQALGRVLAESVFSIRSVPHYHAAAMDGICVTAEKTFGADEHLPMQLKKFKDFEFVDTGNEVKPPYNSVIMIEYVQIIDKETIEIRTPATPWQHIRPIGEDFLQGDLLLPLNHKLRPVDLGALLAGGILTVPVIKQPFITIIPTGNEIVRPDEVIENGNIVEFNGTVFAAYIEEWGGKPSISPIVRDEPENLRAALLKAVKESDLVVINAGSSAGSKDYTVHIIKELGKVFVHGIATRPGKPVILGEIDNTLVVGLPGYPISAYLALEWFVKPFIEEYQGFRIPKRHKIQAKLGRRIVSTIGSEDFIRMNVGYLNGEYVANPRGKAAGVISSLVKADGLLVVPTETIGYEQGDIVEIELYRSEEEIKGSFIVTGSHDLSIDLLEVSARSQGHRETIVSSHVGSMAGIMAIKKGEAHIAGIHLLDPETGVYNKGYIQKFLAGMEVVQIPFLKRMQGWIVEEGNPYGINNIKDIGCRQIPFVNRQKGAGTRILLDLLIKEAGLKPESILGYHREMFNHISVAAEIKATGGVGLGIAPAAGIVGCDFVPVQEESYDWIMTKEFFQSDQGQKWFQWIQSPTLIETIEKVHGYRIVRDPKPLYYK